jgi:hypothetical protein
MTTTREFPQIDDGAAHFSFSSQIVEPSTSLVCVGKTRREVTICTLAKTQGGCSNVVSALRVGITRKVNFSHLLASRFYMINKKCTQNVFRNLLHTRSGNASSCLHAVPNVSLSL